MKAFAMFLDTETPGFKPPLQPIEVAYRCAVGTPVDLEKGDMYEARFALNGRMMELGAISAHNILPSELEGMPVWDAPVWQSVHFSPVPEYTVGHNIDFDLDVLGKPQGSKPICTLALSRYFYPDIDSHKLAAMVYYLFGFTTEVRERVQQAHGAAADVNLCGAVFEEMCTVHGIRTWGEAYAASEIGRIPIRMSFGKHGPKDGKKGTLIRDMVKNDRDYVKWLRNNIKDDPYLIKALDNPR